MPMRPPRHQPPRLDTGAQDKRAPDHRLSPTRRGYNRRWERLAESIRIRDNYTCKLCGRLAKGMERDGERCKPPVDHIVPHNGQDDPAFWNESNLRTLCADCHNAARRGQSK